MNQGGGNMSHVSFNITGKTRNEILNSVIRHMFENQTAIKLGKGELFLYRCQCS
jgi:hypothetical protein